MAEISVIVPVYNTSKYLKACLSSLSAQTWKDFEIIAVNDGSGDHSLEILNEYAKKEPRLKVVNQKNQGIGAVRNLGIQLASGSYITFIDSDDTIYPSMLERLHEKAVADDLDIVVCDYTERYEANGQKKRISLPDFEPCSLKERPQLLFDINSSPWNKLYRISLFRDYGITFPQKLKYEDAYAVLLCLVKAKKIGKVNETLMEYWIHAGSESTVMDQRVFDIFTILTKLKEAISSDENYDTIAPYFEYFAINRITVYMLQQKYQKEQSLKQSFIEQGYEYLNKMNPDWRTHPLYLQSNSRVKRLIKGNKRLMKYYTHA